MIQKNFMICQHCIDQLDQLSPGYVAFYKEICALYVLDMPLEIDEVTYDEVYQALEQNGFILSFEVSQDELVIRPQGYYFDELDDMHKFCPLDSKHFPLK